MRARSLLLLLSVAIAGAAETGWAQTPQPSPTDEVGSEKKEEDAPTKEDGGESSEAIDPSDACLNGANPSVKICLQASLVLAAEGKTEAAALLAEKACALGEPKGCARAGQLLLGSPATRARAKLQLVLACDGDVVDACIDLGDSERGGLFGEPNDTDALYAYQRGCAIERTLLPSHAPTTTPGRRHGPACAAMIEVLGEDPFASPKADTDDRDKANVKDDDKERRIEVSEREARPENSPEDSERVENKGVENKGVGNKGVENKKDNDRSNDPLLVARARFPLGGFLLEGGGRLTLGLDSNPLRLTSPLDAPAPGVHGIAGTLTLAPLGRIRFDLLELFGVSVEVSGDWTGFLGGDLGLPASVVTSPGYGGYNVDVAAGLGREIFGDELEQDEGERGLLSLRNRTSARTSPGNFLEVVDVGTARAEREWAAPHLFAASIPTTPYNLVGVSENLFNFDARLDFLINLEFGYAWTRRRVEFLGGQAIEQTLLLPLFFLPVSGLNPESFDENAGRARAGLSLPKFDFLGPAHLYGEFSIARRAYGVREFYPSTARAGLDLTASVFEIRADAGAGNTGFDKVFGSQTHFVGGLTVAVPLVAKWWLQGIAQRRLLATPFSSWGLVTTGELRLENRGRAVNISVHGSGGTTEFDPLEPQQSDAFFGNLGAYGELHFGPFRPSLSANLSAYVPRRGPEILSSRTVIDAQLQVGIGF